MWDTRDKGDLVGSLITFFKNEIVLVFSLQIVSIFLSLVCPPAWKIAKIIFDYQHVMSL